MTIFDSGYSAFKYEPTGPLRRLWPLARSEFLKIFKHRKSLILFIACVVYVVVMLVLVFVNLDPESLKYQQGLSRLSPRLSPFQREFYLGYSVDQGFLAFILLTAHISVRSIAGDKAVNALEILWTRGIGPWGYFLAKWIGSFLLLASVFLAGPLVVWLYGLISAPDLQLFHTTIEFIPQVFAALTLKCLVLSFLAVGFSALGSSPNIVTFFWLVLILGSAAVVRVLKLFSRIQSQRRPEEIQDTPIWYDALCPWDAMVRVEKDMAGMTGASEYSVWIAGAMLAGLCLFLLLRLRKCLRTTEAMA